MDNMTANKNNVPCQSWVGQNDWSQSSSQGSLPNPLASSHYLSLNLSSQLRPSYNYLQGSGQNCLNMPSTMCNTHHSATHKTVYINSSPSSATIFANASTSSITPNVSIAQQSLQTPLALFTSNQNKTVPPSSLPQPNQGIQHFGSSALPLMPSLDSYRDSFLQTQTNQGLPSGLQDLSVRLSSCGQHINTSQVPLERVNVESAISAEYTQNYGLPTAREQPQWTPATQSCRSVNKSVFHVATHHHNEQPQNSTSSPQKIQRSVLLYQRAQLLKHLEEVDNLLDSLPPVDTDDGQTVNTALESHLPAASSSPATYDNNNDICDDNNESCDYNNETCDDNSVTCDSQKDPVSAGKTEIHETTLSDSDDESDSDYVPENDVDAESSDSTSDSNTSCSEKSHHSVSPPPTDDEPAANKTVATSQHTKSKDKPENDKKASEIVVMTTSNSKSQRVYDRRNYCLFCSRSQLKMPRHLERFHSDRPEVAVAFQYQPKSKERNKIWRNLVNQGNFEHNKNVFKTGKGMLVVKQRPVTPGQADDYLPCFHCHAFILKRHMAKHVNKCPEKVKAENESQFSRRRVRLRCALEIIDLDISEGFKDLLCNMLDDEVTQGIIEDKILLQFGEQMFHFYSGDRRRREYMRQNLRQLSRLVLEARKTTPLKNLEDFFYPSSFRHVVSAVKVVAGYNAETKMFKIPSLAVKLGYHLQKACSIVESNALKLGDKDLAKSAQNFLLVYQRKWNMLVSSGALSNMNESKMNTDKMVPLVQDVKLLYSHLEKVHEVVEKDLRDNVTQENYVTLAKVMIARMFFFNRRKASEISSITLRNFMSRKKCDVLDEMDVSVTDLERTLCSYFTRVDMRGSCGRVVPVFLKPTFESALELLVKTRELCAVPKENIYLFGRPNAKSNFKGPKSVYQLAKECGVENLNTMTAKKIQKHFGKMLLWMNLNGEEVDQILGPNHQAHTIRAELETGERDFEGEQAASPCYSEHSTFSCEQANQNYKQERGTPTGVQQKGKQKWEVAEVRAVERHLMHFITTHKVPQKNDCIQCLEAEPQSLKTRSWKGVKDYVRNRITALKRESNRSEHAPKNEKKPRREEQEEDDL